MSMLFDVYLVHIAASQSQRSFFVLLPADKGMGIDDISTLENQFYEHCHDLGYLVNFNKLKDEIAAQESDGLRLLSRSELQLIRSKHEQPYF
ncbi:hypothetical protein NBNDMPCG_00021 [Klebsiella phage vB_KqM-Westerburg]|nr:hypothetical protein NBNDMPCG_00021 [Klebsiella phage vB_KqM-Westerburg]